MTEGYHGTRFSPQAARGDRLRVQVAHRARDRRAGGHGLGLRGGDTGLQRSGRLQVLGELVEASLEAFLRELPTM